MTLTRNLDRQMEAIRRILNGAPDSDESDPLLQGAEVVNAPPGFPRKRIFYVTLFDRYPIRDTNTHFPIRLAPLSGMRWWAFEVFNDLNQSVNVYPIGGFGDNPRSGRIGTYQTIAANTLEPIVTDDWLPWYGCRVDCSTAPTTGTLSIRLALAEA